MRRDICGQAVIGQKYGISANAFSPQIFIATFCGK